MTKKKVLVIDDEEDAASLLCEYLNAFGCNSKPLSKREDIKETLDQYRPDLITLDLHMPGMSGVDVLNKIKECDAGKSIPVIIISVNDAQTLGQDHLALCESYMVKPVPFKEFKEKILAALS